ncbi:MAG: hypothetical protein OXG81_02730 [Acidobacteria bacterium]|nr:hypothetical protein [Acidobacteriota bacterium]
MPLACREARPSLPAGALHRLDEATATLHHQLPIGSDDQTANFRNADLGRDEGHEVPLLGR